jgi:hypothetical protein
MAIATANLVEFLRSFPGFSALGTKDQITLFRHFGVRIGFRSLIFFISGAVCNFREILHYIQTRWIRNKKNLSSR